MSSEVLLKGATGVKVTVRHSPRARSMRLSVDPRTARVMLTVPRRMSEKRALEWAAGHRGWIERALAEIPEALPLGPGSIVPFRGEPHRIEWQAGGLRTVRLEQGQILVGGPAELVGSRLLRWLRSQAVELLAEESRLFADRAGVTLGKVGVGDPMSRWGSCSSSGAIRYSWRLILAPDWVRRATVAHEVAHRLQMNHGPAFHALVERLLGADPKPARDWLKRHGASLHRFGRG
jgi:predicted metal-dependent hydrolase